VQCDGYAAYKTVANAACGEAIMLAFCWAHLRRGFFDIAKGGSAPTASEALERIAAPEEKAPASDMPYARRRASLSCSRSKPGLNNSSRASRVSP
jgi:transposase